MRQILLFLLFTSLFFSCENKENYQIATSTKSASYLQVGEDLAELFELENDARFEVLSGERMGSDMNVHLLADLKVDFALAQGDTKIQNSKLSDFKNNHHIKTVLPLYPEVLFIIYPDSINANSLAELVKGRKVGLGPKEGGTASFMRKLFSHYGIPETDYEPVYTSYSDNIISDAITISCALTGYNNKRIHDMLVNQKHKIFSLGEVDLAFKGSSVDGFCLVHGPARPFILPKYTYINQPSEPVLTVAVDAILFTHENVDKYLIYQLTEAIFNNKQYLGNKNNLLARIKEQFDLNDLNYPLHEGARMYFERDKPSFAERYGKLLGSMLIAIVTGIPMVINWHRQRKKDRIDTFYKAVLEKEQKVSLCASQTELEVLKSEVHTLRNQAFTSLIEERLDANPSFRIFTDLLQETSRLIEIKEASFRSK